MLSKVLAIINNLDPCTGYLVLCVYSALSVSSFQFESPWNLNQQHCASDLPLPVNMRFLVPLFCTVSLATASYPALLLSTRQSVICQILPIAANAFNGNIPCGGGSVISACTCCADGMTTCSTALQTCQIGAGGGYVCQDSSALSGASSCSAQGLVTCDNGCMPSGQTCCGPIFCKGTESCCSLTDGTPACCTSDASGPEAATSTVADAASTVVPDSAATTGSEGVQSDSLSTPTSATSAEGSLATPNSQSSTSSNAPTPSNPGSRINLSYIIHAGGVAFAVVFG